LSRDVREERPLIRGNSLERMTGIEPALSAWEDPLSGGWTVKLSRRNAELPDPGNARVACCEEPA
jgi:hypothetical protein